MEPDVLDDREVLWRPHPGPQTRFLQSTQFEVLYGGALGGGKVLWDNDLVLSPKGWIRGQDIKKGDAILHPFHGEQEIAHVFAEETLDVWRVHFSDGTSLPVAKEHLWQAWRSGRSRKKKGGRQHGRDSKRVVSTETLKEWVEKAKESRDSGVGHPCWPLIPVNGPLEFTNPSVLFDRWYKDVDPYVLGVLLGDGTLSSLCVTTGAEDLEWMTAELGEHVRYVGGPPPGRTASSIFLHKDRIRPLLDSFGYRNETSLHKFVPDRILYSRQWIRRAVLQGLMDTDGSVWSNDGACRVEFTSTSHDLAWAVAHMVRSLGGRARIRRKSAHYLDDAGDRVQCNDAYQVDIRHPQPWTLFRMPRKVDRARELAPNGLNVYRRVVDVTVEPPRTGRCIAVSNPDGLYIASDGEDPSGFVVTHNSDALLFGGLRHISKPHYKAVFIRHTYPALQEMIDRSFVFKRLGGEWNASEKRWTFPSGAIYEFKYFERWEHHANFQGHQYQYIAWDEIGLCPEERFWVFLATRCRSPRDAEVIPQMVASANPGGAGHAWVKRRWVDKCGIAGEHVYVDPDTGLDRRFIPARLTDNPTLLKNDPQYLRVLHGLPEMMQRQLLEGDWGAAVGMALGELDEKTHIITKEDPRFNMNPWGRFFGAFDWGYSHPASFGFFEERPGKQLVLVDSLSMWRKTPIEIAERVEDKAYQLGAELGMKDRPLPLDMVYASRDCFNVQKARGEDIATIAEHFHDVGMTMTMANQNRIHGLNNLRQYVTVIGPERTLVEPKLLIRDTPTNREVFDCLEGMVVDPKDPEDALKVDADEYGLGGDDPYDMVRYGCASRPLVVRAPREKPKKPRDYDHGGDAAFQRMGEVYKRTRRFHGMGIRG